MSTFIFRSLRYLTTGLRNFVVSSQLECSPNLRYEFSSSLPLFFSSPKFDPYNEHTIMYTGRILFNLTEIGIEKPRENCIWLLIPICKQILIDSNTQFKSIYSLVNIHHIANTFLAWNIDANKYYEKFWYKFFESIKIQFESFIVSNDFLRTVVLKSCLHVASQFDQEENFQIIRLIWLVEMKCVLKNPIKSPLTMQHLLEIKTLIERMKAKPYKIETLLNADIVRHFEEM